MGPRKGNASVRYGNVCAIKVKFYNYINTVVILGIKEKESMLSLKLKKGEQEFKKGEQEFFLGDWSITTKYNSIITCNIPLYICNC